MLPKKNDKPKKKASAAGLVAPRRPTACQAPGGPTPARPGCPAPQLALQKETAEQRAARLEMEAVAAQEADRHRAELARVQLQEAQARDQAAARVNAHRLTAEWLQRMRQAKMETLRVEASALVRQHDWECDRRDRQIEVGGGPGCAGGTPEQIDAVPATWFT